MNSGLLMEALGTFLIALTVFVILPNIFSEQCKAGVKQTKSEAVDLDEGDAESAEKKRSGEKSHLAFPIVSAGAGENTRSGARDRARSGEDNLQQLHKENRKAFGADA